MTPYGPDLTSGTMVRGCCSARPPHRPPRRSSVSHDRHGRAGGDADQVARSAGAIFRRRPVLLRPVPQRACGRLERVPPSSRSPCFSVRRRPPHAANTRGGGHQFLRCDRRPIPAISRMRWRPALASSRSGPNGHRTRSKPRTATTIRWSMAWHVDDEPDMFREPGNGHQPGGNHRAYDDGRFTRVNIGNGILELALWSPPQATSTTWCGRSMSPLSISISIRRMGPETTPSPARTGRGRDLTRGSTALGRLWLACDRMRSFQDPEEKKPYGVVIETAKP